MKPFLKQIKVKKPIGINIKDTTSNSLKKKLREQGPFELSFRKLLYREIRENKNLEIMFREVLMNLFTSQQRTSRFNLKTSELVQMSSFCKTIWDEFITLCDTKGIEKAISIIFKRYEQ